jgi:outer membrane lipoprotein SlyB
MYRLCSPNYNGVFEFNAAKNYGVSSFNVDITYKPYNPYIHLNPNFKGLYGQDFNDSRGLVVGGDFSLPQATSSWESYQLNNKNFQASFDRQIENMEVNNNIQMSQAVAQAALGTVGGVLGGFMAGGIGGAVAGGAAAAAGGVLDVAMTKAAQVEALDYTKDQFGYSLGNIKAQATSLSKTSAIVYNNKLFPFLEYYTCTDEEKTALENKIKYNGMTVMRIGTIREFLKSERTYIKGKLIRVENILEDFHYVNELANEFNKGVFI